MKRLQLLTIVLAIFSSYVWAQRPTDKLGRGLVAVKTDAGVFLSWRILGEEYYDVNYNVYRDGTRINATPLSLSNFVDKGGSYGNTYTVSAVVRGVEQSQCNAVSVWSQYKYKLNTTCETGYFNIPLARVYNNSGQDITNTYIANDAEVADLDGDGEMEIILKRRSTLDDGANYVSRTDGAYDRIDAYKMDGTLLWWIDVGPNMVSGGSHELNIIAYDWDGDGKAEVLLRGADNMMVHGQRGASRQEWPQRIGKNGVDTRGSINHTANMTYTNTGDEFLVYMDGDHGIIYDAVRYMSYPIPRGKASDWGDDYGHRSSKYFMGAPFLDGKKPSILLARGIYTKHEMRAFDVDPATHTLTERWHWSNNGGWNDPWYGNGNHNFCIADVDEDGRDEIVYGSMVVDDNGHGLSTTGLGHGDALHCSDFDPYRKGLEIFACNEDEPAMNYRNATTSKIYYRQTGSSDDGRALCANFSNVYPGAMGRSTQTGMVSCVKDAVISEIGDYIAWSDLNFRIYWDGDLLSEVLNSPGTEREAAVIKPGSGRLFTSSGCKMNNWSKNHPCFSGDILGDWREEMILRVGEGHDSIRIYTTAMPTNYPIYTLWHDHQYRQAMVWQMHAYNQPPHLSYFLGEMEGITVPPPPLTTTNRTVIVNGTTINSSYNNQHILHNEYANTSLNVTDGASPYILTVNVPVWIQGADSYIVSNANVNTVGYSCNLNGGALTGSMRLIKQGNGTLNMAKVNHTFTGETNIWGGTVNFDGSLKSSKVWMNRFTTLNSDGGQFPGAFVMEYGATLNVGGATSGKIGSVSTGDMTLNYGSRIVLDINGSKDGEHDVLNLNSLTIDDSKVGVDAWENFGPQYIAPILQLRMNSSLDNGIYPIGTCKTVTGDLSKVIIESSGMNVSYLSLVQQNNMLCLKVQRPAVNESKIEIVDMARYSGSSATTELYLPVVGITTTETNGQTPKLSGTFTNLDGVTTSVGSESGEVIFSQNYENETAISGWTSNGANISLGTGDATYGKYFYINTGSTNTRYAYQRISSVDVSSFDQYTIDFDLALKSGNTDGIEFCVMSKNGTNPTTNWDNYAYINGNANMLFDLTAAKGSTSFNVNGTSTTTTLASETWYHVTLKVNQSNRNVVWSISNGSSGTFELPSGTSTEFDGFYLVAGRYYSTFKLDNIVIKSAAVDLSTYTFKEPGTLTITSYLSDASYSPSVVTFEVPYPYTKLYESPDYSTIQASDAATVLGGSFSSEPFNSRWAYWSKENATYGQDYVMVSSGKDSGYLDKDARLYFNRTSSDKFHLVQGFGIGHNYVKGNTTISASNLGDKNTLVYYKADLSRGGNAAIDKGFTHANADGSWTYELYQNTTFCKFIAYKPYRFLLGDLNHDGYVNITDVVLLVNYILGKDDGIVIEAEADINGDGFVNITDVVTLTNIILNNE
ncbi:MAG: hypothetical protein IKH63_02835 [Prevotella sp.]|nr:hypothetical protein [Prevotella sp.]